MAQITLKGNPINTIGDLPSVGSQAKDFTLVKSDLSEVKLFDFKGQRVILNIFPSIDTSTCATSVRTFNEQAASLKNTIIMCISADLPFAHQRFCGAEGIADVLTLSNFRDQSFGSDYGVELIDGPLKGLCARSIVVLDEHQNVVHAELVSETVDEPNYELALQAVK